METHSGQSPHRAGRPSRGPVERAAGVLLTPRDYAGLALCARLGAIRADDLAGFLAWHAGRESIGARTASGIVSRWHRLGLVEARRYDAGQPRAWTATPLGARLVGWAGPVGFPPLAEHRHALAVGALAVAYMRAGALWITERELRHEAGHTPDGVAEQGGQRVAVEVERTRKPVSRWAPILADLMARYDRADYWAPPDVARALTGALPECLTTEDLGRVRVLDLTRWQR